MFYLLVSGHAVKACAPVCADRALATRQFDDCPCQCRSEEAGFAIGNTGGPFVTLKIKIRLVKTTDVYKNILLLNQNKSGKLKTTKT